MDDKLKKKGVRIFNNVHVSGHAGREDLRDLINMLNAEHIIPAHGGQEKLLPMMELCHEMGYKKDKNVHLMSNGAHLEI
jgi:ribonuclease J